MIRPVPRMVYNRKSERAEIQELKAAHRDPADLVQKVAAYQVYLAQKKVGRLPAYEIVGNPSLRSGTASRSGVRK